MLKHVLYHPITAYFQKNMFCGMLARSQWVKCWLSINQDLNLDLKQLCAIKCQFWSCVHAISGLLRERWGIHMVARLATL